jgi:hypothetical protein
MEGNHMLRPRIYLLTNWGKEPNVAAAAYKLNIELVVKPLTIARLNKLIGHE